jgi:hypothetical protein
MAKYHVRAGGGIWEGVQPHLMDPEGATVLFRNPDDHALLCLDLHVCDSTQVRFAITEHKRKQNAKPIKIPRSWLVQHLDKLTDLAAEVKLLLEEKQ